MYMINNLKFLHLIMMYFEFYISIEVGSKLALDSKMLAYNYLTNIFFTYLFPHDFFLYDKCILESSWYVLFDIFYNTCTLIKSIQNISVKKQYLELILVFQS